MNQQLLEKKERLEIIDRLRIDSINKTILRVINSSSDVNRCYLTNTNIAVHICQNSSFVESRLHDLIVMGVISRRRDEVTGEKFIVINLGKKKHPQPSGESVHGETK